MHIISMDNDYLALYNSLSLEVAFLKKDFIKKCQKNELFVSFDESSQEILMTLNKLGIIVKEEANGYELYQKYQKNLENPAINILYLLLTDTCNIRCKYCYFLAPMSHDYQPSLMKKDTAIKALDFFARCVKKSVAKGHPDQHIIIYGGEPTLNKEVILEVLIHIDKLKKDEMLPETISITINTNGILLDKQIINQCKKTGVVIAFSIDGPKEIHDQMRVYASGRGTYDEVIQSYKIAQQSKAKTGVCVTIDRHNLSHMEEIVQWLAKDLDVKGMGFNILIDNMEASGDEEYYARTVSRELIKSFKVARKIGIYEDRMMRRVKNFIDKRPVFSDCGGCGLQVVISPDGKIGVCQAFCGKKKFFIEAPFENFEPEAHPFWKQWRKRSPLSNELCKSCIALGNCGGGCPYNAYQKKGDINALDERFCVHAKETTYFLIHDLWNEQKEKINLNRK